MQYQDLDLVIIGAGPAGLAAGMCSAYTGVKTLIFEEKIPGGLAAEIPLLESYPGFGNGITGSDLVGRMVEHCKKAGAEIHQLEKVVELSLKGKIKTIKTEKSNYRANAVIITSGGYPKILGVPGENEFRGKGVSYCAVCDGAFFKGKEVTIIGEGSPTAEAAVYLSGLASSVKLVCQKDKLEAEKIHIENLWKREVEILSSTELREIKGDIVVRRVVLFNKRTGETREIDTDGVFFQLEEIPNSQLARESGVKVDKDGYIVVDERGRTNINGVYAAGDVTNCPIKQVVTAVAQASTAANEVFEYIREGAFKI